MEILSEEKIEYLTQSDNEEIEVEFKNPIKNLGFAQIEHILCFDEQLSDGAYRTLAALHYFWQQKDSAYPSIKTLAELRGKTTRTISEHLAELESRGLITRKRRYNASSITYLEDLPKEYVESAKKLLSERHRKKISHAYIGTGRKLPHTQEENFQLRITREEEQDNIPFVSENQADDLFTEEDEKRANQPREKITYKRAKEMTTQAIANFGKSNGHKCGVADAKKARDERELAIAGWLSELMRYDAPTNSVHKVAKRIASKPYDVDWIRYELSRLERTGEFRKDGASVYWVTGKLEDAWAAKTKEDEKIWVFSN